MSDPNESDTPVDPAEDLRRKQERAQEIVDQRDDLKPADEADQTGQPEPATEPAPTEPSPAPDQPDQPDQPPKGR